MREYTKGDYALARGYKTVYEGVSIFGNQYFPNEDSFACGLDRRGRFTAGVFDGVKTLNGGPEFPSPEVTAGKLASRSLAYSLLEYTDLNLKEALLVMNSKRRSVNGYLKPLKDVESGNLPAAGGTVVRVDPESARLDLAYAGNTKLIVELKTGEKKLHSDVNNEKCNALFIAAIVKLAEVAGLSLPEFAKLNQLEIESLKRKYILNNFNADTELGFGIFNGDPALEKFIYTDSYKLEDVSRCLLVTDGIIPAMLDLSRQDDMERLTDASFRLGLVKVVQIKNRLNQHDPEWKNFPRISASDDATAIAFSVSRSEAWKQIYETAEKA